MRALIVFLAFVLAACGSKNDADLCKSVGSWDASIALAADAWLKHEVPAHYLHDAAEAAADSLQKEQASTKDASPRTSGMCAESLRAIRQISSAVEDHNDASVTAALQILRRDQRLAK